LTKFLKSIPVVGSVVEKIDQKIDEVTFNIKSVQGKIETIFSGFDQSYKSLNKSIDMQKEFLEGLEKNIGKVKAYKEYVAQKLEEFKQKAQDINDETEKQKYDMFIRNVEYFL
jgi:archaellum component FlaC